MTPRKDEYVPTFSWTNESTVELHANSSVHPINGEIHDVRGEVTVDVVDGKLSPGPGTKGHIEADVDSLKSGNKLEDMALRKQVEAKKFPTVRYEVLGVEGGPEQFKVRGSFTFHGTTQEFTEDVTARLDGDKIHVSTEHTFDITQFGVQPFKLLTMKIFPEVRLVLRLVGTQVGAGAGGGGGYGWG